MKKSSKRRAPASGLSSPKELALVGPAIEYVKVFAESHEKFPTVYDLRRHLRCDQVVATRVMRHIKANIIPGMALNIRKLQNAARHDRLTKVALLDQALGDDKMHASDEEYYVRENSRLQRAVVKARQDRSAVSRAHRELAQRSIFAEDDIIKEIAAMVPETAQIREKVAVKFGVRGRGVFSKTHSEDAVFCSGDQHYGAKYRRVDVSGFPQYNILVAANRTEYATRKVIKLIAAHGQMYRIDNLWWAILGDIGAGNLHDSAASNELFVPAQIDFAFNMLDLQMQHLLGLKSNKVIAGDIIAVKTVGNHMRVDEKMPLVYQAQRTHDWLITQMLYNKYKSHTGVQFVEDDSPFVFVNIKGHKYCFTHGSQANYENDSDRQIKGLHALVSKVRAIFDSPVYRKNARPYTPVTELEAAIASYAGETFSRMVIGNIHVPISMPRICTNGSLPGQNELGVNWTLEPIPAGQWLFGVDDKRTKTFEYFLDVTEKQEEGDNEFLAFAKEYQKRYAR